MSPEFDDAVDPYLRDDERVVAGGVLDGGWLALTPDRCLVYAADEDRLRAVHRADVTGIERTVVATAGNPGRALQLSVYGLVAVGAGLGADRVSATLSTGLDGTADVPAVGSVLALVDLVRTGLTALGWIARGVGLLLVVGAVALGVRWYRSRRPTVVVETVEGPVRVSGTAGEVDALLADVGEALGDRPDPGTLFE